MSKLLYLAGFVVFTRVFIGILYGTLGDSDLTGGDITTIAFGGIPDPNFPALLNSLLIFATNAVLFVALSEFFGGGVVGGIIGGITAAVTGLFSFLFS